MSGQRIGQMARPEMTEALEGLLDVFTGADGGGDFVTFCNYLREVDQMAAEGSPHAIKAIQPVLDTWALVKQARRSAASRRRA